MTMKIQSRKESLKLDRPSVIRFGKYKTHENTTLLADEWPHSIHVVGGYVPDMGCPPDAQPWTALAFGMDGRRFLLTLEHEELLTLKRELDTALAVVKPRRVK